MSESATAERFLVLAMEDAAVLVPMAFVPKITGMIIESLTIDELHCMLMHENVSTSAALCLDWLDNAMSILHDHVNVIDLELLKYLVALVNVRECDQDGYHHVPAVHLNEYEH